MNAKILLKPLLWRLYLAAFVPVFGDEAYFLLWGLYPKVGYYDHPPFIGWWASLGLPTFLLRLPSVFVGFFIFYIFKNFFKDADKNSDVSFAEYIAYFPMISLFFLTTTETFLLYGAWGGLALCLSALNDEKKSLIKSYLSGLFFGVSFLSKFFSGAFIAVSGIEFLSKLKANKKLDFLFWIFGLSPFVFLLFYWNSQNCWTNFVFNFFSRHEKSTNIPFNILSFFLIILMYFGPLLWFFSLKFQRVIRKSEFRVLFCSGLFGVLVFALSTFRASISLHWFFAFSPMIGIALFYNQSDKIKKYAILWNKCVFYISLFGALLFLAFPEQMIPKKNWLKDYVVFTYPEKILHELKKNSSPGDVLVARDYTTSSVLSLENKKRIPVFVSYSRYGRQDDFWTDYSKLNKFNFRIFSKKKPKIRFYKRFFKRIYIRKTLIEKRSFWIIYGKGFKYYRYKKVMKRIIKKRYPKIDNLSELTSCPLR